MTTSIGTTRVEDVMIEHIVTVASKDKMEDVAKIFQKHDINFAPVVSESGECVGVITNHDLAEYEAVRVEITSEVRYGHFYNLAKYGDGDIPRLGICFDEVSCHMTKVLETARRDDPLSKIARIMCGKHIHHVVILDDARKLVGILSSLDILGYITGVPVCRNANCGEVS